MLEVSHQTVVSTALTASTSDVALDGLAATWLHEKTNRSGSPSTHRTFLVNFRTALT